MAETWFDTRTGDLLIGAAAAEARIEEAGPDIVPLRDLINDPNFMYKFGDFVDKPSSTLRVEETEAVNIGHWVLNVLHDGQTSAQTVTRDQLRRLAILGIVPSANFYKSRHGTFNNFRHQIGSPYGRAAPHAFSDWIEDDWRKHAQRVERWAKRMPTRTDYIEYSQTHQAPTIWNIAQLAGGVLVINELIGYWNKDNIQPEQYVDYGANVVTANGTDNLITPVISILSRRGRGPSFENIRQRVGWSTFRKRSLLEAQRQAASIKATSQSKLAYYQALIASDRLPAMFAQLSEEDVVTYGAYFQLVDACLPHLPDQQKQSLVVQTLGKPSVLQSEIIALDRSLQATQIEGIALKLNILEDIWRPEDTTGYLYVSDDELSIERQRVAQVRQLARKRKTS